MSARLPPAPLTKEDRLIWLRINLPLGQTFNSKKIVSPAYHAADRRDSELMWRRRCHLVEFTRMRWIARPWFELL